VNRLVLLLEEESMRVLLDGLLPRLFPGLPFQCVPHRGKSDLERSIPRKLRGWRDRSTSFRVFMAGIEAVAADLAARESGGDG